MEQPSTLEHSIKVRQPQHRKPLRPGRTTTTASWLALLLLVAVVAVLLLVWAVRGLHHMFKLRAARRVEAVKGRALLAKYTQPGAPGVLAVWPLYGGSFAWYWLQPLLEAAFPGTAIVMSAYPRLHAWIREQQQQQQQQQLLSSHAVPHHRRYGSVVLASSFRHIDIVPPPRKLGLPVITWNGEAKDVKGFPHAVARLVAARPREVQAAYPHAEVHYVAQAWLTPGVDPQHFRVVCDDDIALRCYDVGFMASNCKGFRDRLFYALKRALGHDAVVARGLCGRTGVPGLPAPRRRRGHWNDGSWPRIMSDCKILLAVENTVDVAGYVTEKLVNAFLAGAVPVYWGDSAAAARWFNPAAYIDVAKYDSVEDAVADIAALARDAERLRAMRAAPVLRDHAADIGKFTRDAALSADWKEVVNVFRPCLDG